MGKGQQMIGELIYKELRGEIIGAAMAVSCDNTPRLSIPSILMTLQYPCYPCHPWLRSPASILPQAGNVGHHFQRAKRPAPY